MASSHIRMIFMIGSSFRMSSVCRNIWIFFSYVFLFANHVIIKSNTMNRKAERNQSQRHFIQLLMRIKPQEVTDHLVCEIQNCKAHEIESAVIFPESQLSDLKKPKNLTVGSAGSILITQLISHFTQHVLFAFERDRYIMFPQRMNEVLSFLLQGRWMAFFSHPLLF